MSAEDAFTIPAIAIVGHKNSGKTTLAERVIRAFTDAGLLVAAVKHTSDELGFDKPHKDSDRLRQAGALSVGLIAMSEAGFYIASRPESPEAWIEAVFRSTAVYPDLIVLEGWRGGRVPKIECVLDPSITTPSLTMEEGLIAVVSDHAIDADVPVLAHEPLEPILDLVRGTLPRLRPAAAPR